MISEEANEKSFYKFLLRFTHPSIDPTNITSLLNLEPSYAWKFGEQAKTPNGTLLSPVRKQSYWCYNAYVEDKLFSTEIN